MTVKEIVVEWLKVNGYDGLAGEECGCAIDDLFCCGCSGEDCVPGHKKFQKDFTEEERAEFGDDVEWVIVEGKAPCVKSVKIDKLGTFATVGELKRALEPFEDDVSFGFRNQPMQSLYRIIYPAPTVGHKEFVVFQ